MKDSDYSKKIHNAKTQEERNKINNDFLKSKVRKNKFNKFFIYIKDNLFSIIAIVISIIALFK